MPEQHPSMEGENSAGPVGLHIADSVATLTLNRPQTRNSLDMSMATALEQHLAEAIRLGDQLKAVVLRAEGDHFMVGGDIRYFDTLLPASSQGMEALGRLIQTVNNCVAYIDDLPCPVVVAVQGAVAGVGLSLALACDMIVAADDARFVLAYSALGATPDGGASWQLPRRIGRQKAMDMFLFNEPMDAAAALDVGLVARVVARAELLDAVERLAQRLSEGSRMAQNAGKALIQSGATSDLRAALENERKQFVALAAEQDFAEGVNAFMQKRPPIFQV